MCGSGYVSVGWESSVQSRSRLSRSGVRWNGECGGGGGGSFAFAVAAVESGSGGKNIELGVN